MSPEPNSMQVAGSGTPEESAKVSCWPDEVATVTPFGKCREIDPV